MLKSWSLVFPLLALLSTPAKASTSRIRDYVQLCSQCHGEQLEGNAAVGAPSIAGLPAWYIEAQVQKFRGGLRGKHPKDIAGMRMRPLARTIATDDDLRGIVTHIASLPAIKPTPTLGGDTEKGKAKFQVCIACHGADLAGNEALKAPPLRVQNDWYLATQLRNFKDRVRGGNPTLDASGATMTPMAATLEDEQAVHNVVSYINSLR